MQELIVLDTKVDACLQENRPPLVVCRPQKAKIQPPFEPEPLQEFPEEEEMAELTEEIPSEKEQESLPKIPLAVTSKSRGYGNWIRGIVSALILGLTVWGYPKVCPIIDPICSGIFRMTTVRAQSSVSKEETQPEQPEQEETMQEQAVESEQIEQSPITQEEEQEVVVQSVDAASDAVVIGTIDNMTGNGKVKSQTLSASAGGIHLPLHHGLVKNLTDVNHAVLLKAAKEAPAFTLADTDQPQILIMHTHATESFLSAESESYNTEAGFRTTNKKENIVRIGAEMTAILKQAGIGVLHDTTLHDAKSYSGSYTRSAETVKKYLEKYPSIRIVLDIHRDAIGTDGEITAPTTTIEGRKAAQIMIISGCDDGTMNMPHYMDNFRFAAALQNKLEERYPTLTRPILFDYRKYNQDLTTGSLLIEIGSNANTLDQAVYSGKLFALALAELCGDLRE